MESGNNLLNRFKKRMTLLRATHAGSILLIILLALGVAFWGNQRQVQALGLPFDGPASGSQILCYLNGLEEINGFAVTHPPIPIFDNVGLCSGPAVTQCSNGVDDDGDGLIDLADQGCSSPTDDDESNPPPVSAPACSNGTDDDGDGFVDSNDPNCHTDGDPNNFSSYNPNGVSETGALPTCWNGVDDDGDGKTDFPLDQGCSSATDTDETDPSDGGGGGVENTLQLCSDGLDNDNDAKVDLADSDCASFRPTLTVTLVVVNDDNGTSTVSDFSLHVATSSLGSADAIGISSGVAVTLPFGGTWVVGEEQNSGYTTTFGGDCNSLGQVTLAAGETKNCTITSDDVASNATACSDGIDNDGDGLIDSIDPGCSDASDDDEADSPSDGSSSAPPPSGGGGRGGGGGGGGSAIAAQIASPAVLGASTTAPVVASGESCDQYLTAFIRSGRTNDAEQVKRLQYVLREFEGVSSVEINGIYDGATLAAVHIFQAKYASEILTPWGIRKSTGYVYLTTRKKVNEIYCRGTNQFPLTAAEEQVIERARISGEAPSVETPIPIVTPSNEAPSVESAEQATVATSTLRSEGRKSVWERVLEMFKKIPGR